MDEATQASWEAGAFAKCLRDAAAAKAAQAVSARALWESVFSVADVWFDPVGDPHRPAEHEAFRNIFRTCRGAAARWAAWQNSVDREVYRDQLAELAAVVREAKKPVQLALWPMPNKKAGGAVATR